MSELVTLDSLIALGLLTACVGGYRLGFVARVASWIGMAVGVLVAFRILPTVLRNAGEMDSLGRLTVVILLLLSGALLGQLVGIFVGSKLSARVPEGSMRTVDHLIGAVAGALSVLVVLWLTLPVAANVPGWTAQQVRSSQIAATIYESAPPPPDALRSLRNLVGAGNFPPVFEGLTEAPDSGPPPGSVALPADVIDRVSASTMHIQGVACHRTQDGSGFVVAPKLVVTNAHVVAGQRETSVLAPNGKSYDAEVVYFDPDRDLALLSVPGLNAQPLPIADPEIGETGAVFGHPGGQAQVEITPAAVRQQIVAVGKDLYERAQTRRDVLILSARLRQGDSGGPLVNTRGQVIGVAFAIAPDNPDTAYALDISELREALERNRSQSVNTGGCLTG